MVLFCLQKGGFIGLEMGGRGEKGMVGGWQPSKLATERRRYGVGAAAGRMGSGSNPPPHISHPPPPPKKKRAIKEI